MTTAARRQPQREKLLRIGEVVRRLAEDFPHISISKIRYLEDEGLMAPRRTQGGYRLFSEDDLERLKTILRMQREEFLPLRVIKDELDAPGHKDRKRRRPAPLGVEDETISLDELCDRAGITLELAKELEEFGLLSPRGRGGDKSYPESDTDVELRRDTSARSERPPGARRRCSASWPRRRFAHATTIAARRGCASCSNSPSSRVSCRRCSSGVTCETWPLSEHRPPHDDPGSPRLPATRCWLQGRDAAAGQPGDAQADGGRDG